MPYHLDTTWMSLFLELEVDVRSNFLGHLMNLCAVHFRFHGLQSCWVFQIRSCFDSEMLSREKPPSFSSSPVNTTLACTSSSVAGCNLVVSQPKSISDTKVTTVNHPHLKDLPRCHYRFNFSLILSVIQPWVFEIRPASGQPEKTKKKRVQTISSFVATQILHKSPSIGLYIYQPK